MGPDVPWDVKWTADFEKAVADLKRSGRWARVKKTIEKIINNPARTGRYKDGTLKGCRTTHVKEKVICWQIKPGVGPEDENKVEELFFLFIAHHDDMGIGINNFSPVGKSTEFSIQLDYYAGFEIEKVIHEIFSACESIDGAQVRSPAWEEDGVKINGTIPPEEREKLESILPESVEVNYDDPALIG